MLVLLKLGFVSDRLATRNENENINVAVNVKDAPSDDGENFIACGPSVIDALVCEGVVPRAVAKGSRLVGYNPTPAPAPTGTPPLPDHARGLDGPPAECLVCSVLKGRNAPAMQVVPYIFAPSMLLEYQCW